MVLTLLVDGDIPIYQCAAAAEKAIKWDADGPLWTLHADEAEARHALDAFLEDMMEQLGADNCVVALSDPKDNFRKAILPTYKANRADKRPPMLRAILREHIKDTWPSAERPQLEGDDVLGIMATDGSRLGSKLIVTIDKDLKSIPGQVLNWNHARYAIETGVIKNFEQAIHTVTEQQADYFHLLQTLAGDPTDGYSGCPGIGMTTADTILSDEPHIVVPQNHVLKSGPNKGQVQERWVKVSGDYTYWETICSYYHKAGLGEEEALTQARVARICRSSDYHHTKKEPILWQPT